MVGDLEVGHTAFLRVSKKNAFQKIIADYTNIYGIKYKTISASRATSRNDETTLHECCFERRYRVLLKIQLSLLYNSEALHKRWSWTMIKHLEKFFFFLRPKFFFFFFFKKVPRVLYSEPTSSKGHKKRHTTSYFTSNNENESKNWKWTCEWIERPKPIHTLLNSHLYHWKIWMNIGKYEYD
jgi:hypothetical protein